MMELKEILHEDEYIANSVIYDGKFDLFLMNSSNRGVPQGVGWLDFRGYISNFHHEKKLFNSYRELIQFVKKYFVLLEKPKFDQRNMDYTFRVKVKE